jgi:Family of unknown function (DUF6348)
MLSALWENHDEDQVLQETWNIDGRNWNVYMGNIVRKAADGADIPPPDDLIPILEQLICKTEFTPEVHWLRLYYANVNSEEQVVEVLLDNMQWDLAQDHLRNAWPHSKDFYSARMFVVFKTIS